MSSSAAPTRLRPLAWMALSGIYTYQRWISPRKGYACAHRIAHGGTGCSGYAKARIQEVGLIKAIPDIRQRFSDCAEAARVLQARREEGLSLEEREARVAAQEARLNKRRRHKDRQECCSCAEDTPFACLEGIPLLRGCGSLGRGRGASNACDHGPDCAPDCGDCAGGCLPG